MDGERDKSRDAWGELTTVPFSVETPEVVGGLAATRPNPERAGLERLPTAELRPGEHIGGYEIIRRRGRGGMGEVYVARDPKLGRRVAIKRVAAADPSFRSRFMHEARATAHCSHENIVVIHEVNEADGFPFMVLEYLEGETLGEVMARGAVPQHRAVELMTAVVRALAHAHGLGIVHRDLKPENVMVTRGGAVKVLDFGIARAFSDGAPDLVRQRRSAPRLSSTRLTDYGFVVGTPPYMSPEQLTGRDVDGRSDVWAVGVLLYEMIAGHHPLGRDLDLDSFLAVGTRTSGSLLDGAEPLAAEPAVVAIVERCVRIDRSERFADADELLSALGGAFPVRIAADSDGCPYPGLSAFDADHAHRFFGRDADIRRARMRLRDEPLVALVGPSGAGKSSLIHAGLVPKLTRSEEVWQVLSLRPGNDPLARLAALAESIEPGEGGAAPRKAHIRAEPGLVGALLRKRATAIGGRVLVCIDQLEELYTLSEAVEDRNAFTASLLAIADDADSPVRVVVTLRSDFLDRASENPAFLDRITRALIFVAPLGRSGLREAIVRPAELAGHHLESAELVDRMLDELEAATGALPLLQFAASKLWDGRDRVARVLTEACYVDMGGIAGALATHADQVLHELPPAGQADARIMFQRLVTPERTRSIVALDELLASTTNPAAGQDVVDRLVAARLLVVRTEGDGTTVELVHESLITRWPTLSQWLVAAEDDVAFVDQLRTSARQWEDRDRPEGLLWRGSALADARAWRSRHPHSELPARERAYLDAVFELDSRARRRRRQLVISGFVVLATIAAAAIIALVWIGRAEHASRVAAERARDEAERRLEAQTQATRASQRAARERARATRERHRRERAESTARTASAQVQQKDLDLRDVNRKLEQSLSATKREAARAQRARAAAEKEAGRARQAEQQLQARGRELERLLKAREQQLRALKKRMKAISTELR